MQVNNKNFFHIFEKNRQEIPFFVKGIYIVDYSLLHYSIFYYFFFFKDATHLSIAA